jgi:hypothetical protein
VNSFFVQKSRCVPLGRGLSFQRRILVLDLVYLIGAVALFAIVALVAWGAEKL